MANQDRADLDPALSEFSQCHVRILEHLDALGRLPAAQAASPSDARKVAHEVLEFFEDVVLKHHRQEETLLFPASLDCADAGKERAFVQSGVERLIGQHRDMEALLADLKPALSALAKGKPAKLDVDAIGRLLTAYREHAAYEEEVYLPLAQGILERHGGELASLALRLHLSKPSIRTLMYFGGGT